MDSSDQQLIANYLAGDEISLEILIKDTLNQFTILFTAMLAIRKMPKM